jgi:hypothetical protein
MAHITIVPAQAENNEELTYDGDVQLDIQEPDADTVIVTVKDADGTDIVFENPKNYTFAEDE